MSSESKCTDYVCSDLRRRVLVFEDYAGDKIRVEILPRVGLSITESFGKDLCSRYCIELRQQSAGILHIADQAMVIVRNELGFVLLTGELL